MPAKTYPLRITSCGDDDHYCLMSKGHHDAAEFKSAAEVFWCEPLQGFDEPTHGWFRAMPDRSGEYASLLIDIAGPGPGAFPATYIRSY